MTLSPEAARAMEKDFPAQIDDETLRDGLQSSSIRQPTPEEAVVLFDLMHLLGTQKADIGFAAAGPIHLDRIKAIARYNATLNPQIEISCAARMTPKDIEPILQLSQETGAHFWADAFLGTHPERIECEGWTQEQMIDWVEKTVDYSVSNDVDVMLVTETTIDGIRKIPKTVEEIYLAGLNKGAKRVCISDTTGANLYYEVREAVHWMRGLLDSHGFNDVGIDFHGHNDLKSAVPNSIAALRAGAQRVHATILNIGEREGNTDRAALQIQLRNTDLDQGAYNLNVIPEYARKASRIFQVPIKATYPGIGEQSRAVVSGVHASAVLKAHEQLPPEKAGEMYLPVNYKELLGLRRSHIVEVGPMAGKANVLLWALLNEFGDITDVQALNVLNYAKGENRTLSDSEIKRLLD